MPTWIIRAGHGGSDPGVVFGNFVEKNLNLIVAQQVKELLEFNGQIVKMVRTGDETVSLIEGIEKANQIGGDFFISIHHDIGSKMIHSVYYSKEKVLAELITREFAVIDSAIHGQAMYYKYSLNSDYYIEMEKIKIPAVISEFAITEPYAYEKLIKEAEAIVKGCCSALEVQFKTMVTNIADWS